MQTHLPLSSSASKPRTLSAELHELNRHFGQEEVALGTVLTVMGDRAYTLMIVLLALPFFTPITLLGVSTVLGAAIAYLGLRLTLGLHPHLPAALRDRRLPPRFFGALLRGTERMVGLLERTCRPRLPLLATGRWTHRATGAGILVAALLLMAPLPIPFTNLLPALAIMALAVGRQQQDGAMVLAGGVALLAALVLFTLLAVFSVEVAEWMGQWLDRAH